MNKQAEKLADFIEKNPNVLLNIDNDAWYILKAKVADPKDEMDYEENQIADDSDYQWMTDWYGASNNYGAGLAEALVILLNRRGFNIKAESV
jgi:hypothetical protein